MMMRTQFTNSGRVAARSSRAGCPPAALVRPAACGSVGSTSISPLSSQTSSAFAHVQLASVAVAAPRRAMRPQRIVAAAATKGNLELVKSQLSSSKRRLSVTVPSSMCQEGFKATVENLKKIVGKLPGFRDDKIPLSMLITQCGGQDNFKRTVIEEILTTTMPLAMGNVGEPVIPDSVRISSDIRSLHATFDPAKPLAYDIEYESVVTKWVKSYKELEVTIKDNGNFATDTKTVENVIRSNLKQKGFQRVVAGRGLQAGDTCVMDLLVCPKGKTTPLTGMKRDKFPWDTEVDPIGLLPSMFGMASGEERKFSLSIPSGYTVEMWRGMQVDVKVKVHEIFNWATPDFDDAFVATHFGKDFSSAEDMRKGLMTTAAMDRVKDLDKQLEDNLVEAVAGCLHVEELPDSLVNEMGATQYRNMLMNMLNTNVATKDELEAMLTEEAIDDYIAENRTDLVDMVKFNMAVDLIYEAEKLTVDDKDIEDEIEVQKQAYVAQGLEYDMQMLRDQVVDSIKHVRVIEWLKDNAKRTVLPYEEA